MLNSRFFILPARLTNHFQLIPRILLLPEVSQSSRPNDNVGATEGGGGPRGGVGGGVHNS